MASRSVPNGDGRSEDSPVDDREGRVGDILRRIYDDAVAEPVPESFEELLRKLG